MAKRAPRIVAYVLVLLICSSGLGFGGKALASMDVSSTAATDSGGSNSDAIAVDRSTFFDEGRYINLLHYENDLSISDFETSGGSMVELEPSGSRYDSSREMSPYIAMQIKYDTIEGLETGVSGFGFICDQSAAKANGSYVSVTYDYIGDLCDIADPSFSIPVSLQATYTIVDGLTIEEEGDYQKYYTGYPVIQLPTSFSYGVFFCGTNELDVRYEFYNADTGEALELGDIYITATSLNRGEGFAVPSEIVTATYVSNDAPDASTLYNSKGLKTPYDIVPGSLLYDKTAEFATGYTTFIGCPDIYDENRTKVDFSDTIGNANFYWRSVCFQLDCGASNTINAKVYAIKTSDWSGTEGVASDGFAANGSLWFAVNFMALTAMQPSAPEKSVNISEDAKLGELLVYRIEQQTNDLGSTSFIRYDSFVLSDTLPDGLSYVSARLLSESGEELSDAAIISYDLLTRTVSCAFTESYLADDMEMRGETYTLEITARISDYPADGSFELINSALVTINNTAQTSNQVITTLLSPELNIEKYVVGVAAGTGDEELNEDELEEEAATEAKLGEDGSASEEEGEDGTEDRDAEDSEAADSEADEAALADADVYEVLVGDVVSYQVILTQTVEGAKAQTLSISDVLPSGLILVEGSVSTTADSGVHIIESGQGWEISLDALSYTTPITITYQAQTTEVGSDSEAVNIASAWARNVLPGSPGSETTPVSDEAEIFIYSPESTVSETIDYSSPQTETDTTVLLLPQTGDALDPFTIALLALVAVVAFSLIVLAVSKRSRRTEELAGAAYTNHSAAVLDPCCETPDSQSQTPGSQFQNAAGSASGGHHASGNMDPSTGAGSFTHESLTRSRASKRHRRQKGYRLWRE